MPLVSSKLPLSHSSVWKTPLTNLFTKDSTLTSYVSEACIAMYRRCLETCCLLRLLLTYLLLYIYRIVLFQVELTWLCVWTCWIVVKVRLKTHYMYSDTLLVVVNQDNSARTLKSNLHLHDRMKTSSERIPNLRGAHLGLQCQISSPEMCLSCAFICGTSWLVMWTWLDSVLCPGISADRCNSRWDW